jgi:ubiquinone/menaquinone biosynthesis C-methylase UbiE
MATVKTYDKFAEVYDKIMSGNFYKDYFIFIEKAMKNLKFKPRNILEVACGTGRLMEIFHKKGYPIEGVDLSEGMLRMAKKKGLKVHRGNMINFKLNKKYDLVLNVFDSLNYVQKSSDLQKCFETANRHMTDKGIFIFDMNSDFKINKIIPTFGVEYHHVGNYDLIWLNHHKPNKWISEMILFSKANGKYERFYEKHVEKAYRLSEVKKLLKAADFEILGIYSDAEFSRVTKTSRRWRFIARKYKGNRL